VRPLCQHLAVCDQLRIERHADIIEKRYPALGIRLLVDNARHVRMLFRTMMRDVERREDVGFALQPFQSISAAVASDARPISRAFVRNAICSTTASATVDVFKRIAENIAAGLTPRGEPRQRLRFAPAAAPNAVPSSWIVKKRLGLHVLAFGKAAR
jgi:hypothetical protein